MGNKSRAFNKRIFKNGAKKRAIVNYKPKNLKLYGRVFLDDKIFV